MNRSKDLAKVKELRMSCCLSDRSEHIVKILKLTREVQWLFNLVELKDLEL